MSCTYPSEPCAGIRPLTALYDEILGTCLDGLDNHGLLSHGRTHNYLGSAICLSDLLEGLDAVHLRHSDVHQHQVGTQLLVLLHGHRPVLCFTCNGVAVFGEDVLDHHPHERCIIANQNVSHIPILLLDNLSYPDSKTFFNHYHFTLGNKLAVYQNIYRFTRYPVQFNHCARAKVKDF